MIRVRALFGALILVVVSVSPTLAGGKPDKVDSEPLPPEVYPAGVLCDFDVEIADLVNTSHSIEFPPAADGSQRVLVGGHIVVSVTNLDTGASVDLNASGPGRFTYGETLRISASGPWFLYFFEGDADGPGIWYTRGRMTVEVDLDTGQVVSVTRPRNTIDVCELLGGHAA